MSDEEARGKSRSSARLPATLLLILIVLISGAVLWLASESPPEKPAPPHADIPLATPPAEKPAETSHPGSPPAEAAHSAAAPAAAPAPAPSQPAAKPPEPAHEAAKPAAPPATEGHADAAKPAPATDHATEPTPAPAPPVAQPAPASEPAKAEKPAGEQSPAPTKSAEKPTPPDPTVVVLPKPTITRLPRPVPSQPLSRAPDPEISEQSQQGPLPVVGRDGREAWRVYARPFDADDKRPKIAAVIYGLGSSAAATRSAIQGLPGAVTLAFTPYADQLPAWMAAARAAGHESLIMVPMEPSNYPEFDPGPQALLTSNSDRENTERLEWMLGRGIGYVGVASFMGSRFAGSARHMRVFLQSLKKRGLLFLQSETRANMMTAELAATVNVPFATNRLYIDGKASRAAIDNQLREAERLAQRLGAAVVMGYPYPVTLERLADWAATAGKRGFALAPVSALAVRKEK